RARVVRLGEGADDDHPAGARVQDLVEVAEVDAADGEPGAGRAEAGRVPDQVRAGGVAAWLGRGGPAGAGAEVVHALLDGGRRGLGPGVGGAADQDVRPQDRAGGGHGEVALAEVEDVGAGGVGHV